MSTTDSQPKAGRGLRHSYAPLFLRGAAPQEDRVGSWLQSPPSSWVPCQQAKGHSGQCLLQADLARVPSAEVGESGQKQAD